MFILILDKIETSIKIKLLLTSYNKSKHKNIYEYILKLSINENKLSMIKVLIEKGKGFDTLGKYFIDAINDNNIDLIIVLVDNGKKELVWSQNNEPLRIAIINNNIEVAKILLDNGAKPTLFRYASQEMKFLINKYR